MKDLKSIPEAACLILAAMQSCFPNRHLPECGKYSPLTRINLNTPGADWLILADWLEENGYDAYSSSIRNGNTILSFRHYEWLGTCFTLTSNDSTEKTIVEMFHGSTAVSAYLNK